MSWEPAYATALIGLAVGVAGTVWSLLSLRATRRAEMWRRFQWAVEAITTRDNEQRVELGWVVLSEVVVDGWTPKADRRRMNATQTQLLLAQLAQRRGDGM